VYDGISPFISNAIRVNGNNMKFPLVGRGDENPLKKVCMRVCMRMLLVCPASVGSSGSKKQLTKVLCDSMLLLGSNSKAVRTTWHQLRSSLRQVDSSVKVLAWRLIKRN
jgi:hypothetical protein